MAQARLRRDDAVRWRELRRERRLGARPCARVRVEDAETSRLAAAVRRAAHPLEGGPAAFDPLLAMIGDARFVLLGEATHGTHEFYRVRAQITKRLIREKGFTAVAVEADWPDAYRVNRYVRGLGDDADAERALASFARFPTWMWRNADVLDFVGWLRQHNEDRAPGRAEVGFYGLDLYAMHSSLRAVLDYLDGKDPDAAKRARERYACFERFGEDFEAYGFATSAGLAEPCEELAVAQLHDIERCAAPPGADATSDERFFAAQCARLVKNAEAYYRTVFAGQAASWNVRDRHMAETLDALVAHLEGREASAKIVVWAHNSHLGDAGATEMAAAGELNLGQLVRERHAGDAVLVGLTTHRGSVTAASSWDGPAERKRLLPALESSYELVFHEAGLEAFLLDLRRRSGAATGLLDPMLERAVGVVYLPHRERLSHYFYASLPEQFDAVLHYDETRAVEPLERTASWERGELPETYPFGV